MIWYRSSAIRGHASRRSAAHSQGGSSRGQLQNVVLLSALDAGVFGGASVSVAEAKAVIDALPPCKYIVRRWPSEQGGRFVERRVGSSEEDKEDLTKLSKDAGTIMAYKNADFGPAICTTLHGQCFQKLNYMNSECPIREAHQGQVLLGRYQGIEMRPKRRGLTGGEGGSNGMLELSESSRVELGLPLSSGSSSGGSGEEQEMWMIFRGGNYCHPAQRGREMHLRLECHHQQEAELQDVTEPETCLYTGVIRTPLAC